jgi:hypothetical protein
MTEADRDGSTFRRKNPKALNRRKPPRLTTEQWTEIVRYSGLPDTARSRVLRVVIHYRQVQARMAARIPPSELRVELDDLQKDARAVAVRLAKCFHNPDMYAAFVFSRRPPTGWPPRTGPVADEVVMQRLVGTVHELHRLSDWLVLARDRVPSSKRGAQHQSQPAYVAAELLDRILTDFTGRNVSRSTKRDDTSRYVKAVLRIADPDIGDGTIMEAIKKQIKWRLWRGEMASSLPEVIPPPLTRDNRRTIRKVKKRNHSTSQQISRVGR